MAEQHAEVDREQIGDDAVKHGVRGAEQAAEDDEQRERERATECDRSGLPQPPAIGELAPVHVAADQGEHAEPRAGGGVQAGPHVVPSLETAQGDTLDGEEGHCEDDR